MTDQGPIGQARAHERVADYSAIAASHREVHERLLNWARWARGGYRPRVAPMFRLYCSAQHWDGARLGAGVDPLDAQRIARAVAALPQAHRLSLDWYYIHTIAIARIVRRLDTSRQGLAQLVHAARAMLVAGGA